jgi:riboflavin kinase
MVQSSKASVVGAKRSVIVLYPPKTELIEPKLGIATANIPLEGLEIGGCSDLDSGVYFGWAGVDLPVASIGDKMTESLNPRANVYPMVMSIGWNPFYKNTVRSVVSHLAAAMVAVTNDAKEVHIMHHFTADFYGHHLNLLILGFIRPEYDYSSKERLIADIEEDIAVSERSLARSPYLKHSEDPYLTTFPTEAGGTNKSLPAP